MTEDPNANPEPNSSVQIEPQHRCPFCHTAVLARDKTACAGCMAWHHADCATDHGRCATCARDLHSGSATGAAGINLFPALVGDAALASPVRAAFVGPLAPSLGCMVWVTRARVTQPGGGFPERFEGPRETPPGGVEHGLDQ